MSARKPFNKDEWEGLSRRQQALMLKYLLKQRSSRRPLEEWEAIQKATLDMMDILCKCPEETPIFYGQILPRGQYTIVKPAAGVDYSLQEAAAQKMKTEYGLPISHARRFLRSTSVLGGHFQQADMDYICGTRVMEVVHHVAS